MLKRIAELVNRIELNYPHSCYYDTLINYLNVEIIKAILDSDTYYFQMLAYIESYLNNEISAIDVLKLCYSKQN